MARLEGHFFSSKSSLVGGSSRNGKPLLPTCLTPSSSQVSYVFSPFWGALPMHAALRFTLLPASLSVPGLERAERAEAALTPPTLLPTRMVGTQLRTQRRLGGARPSSLSQGSLCAPCLPPCRWGTQGETPRCEGAPHFPPPSLGKEKGSPGSRTGGCRPGRSAYLCLVMRLM